MKFFSIFLYSSIVLAVSLPSIEELSSYAVSHKRDNELDTSLITDAIEQLRDNIRSLMGVGRSFSLYAAERGLDPVAYYCNDPEEEKRKQSLTDQDVRYLETFKVYLASGGFNVNEMYCPKKGKRADNVTLFFGISRKFWDNYFKKSKSGSKPAPQA